MLKKNTQIIKCLIYFYYLNIILLHLFFVARFSNFGQDKIKILKHILELQNVIQEYIEKFSRDRSIK